MRAEAFVVQTVGKAFYYRARGPLSALLGEPFLSSCVLKGGFSALALNAPSDQGNSFAILPSGVLVLSLDRESFQVTRGLFRFFHRIVCRVYSSLLPTLTKCRSRSPSSPLNVPSALYP